MKSWLRLNINSGGNFRSIEEPLKDFWLIFEALLFVWSFEHSDLCKPYQ